MVFGFSCQLGLLGFFSLGGFLVLFSFFFCCYDLTGFILSVYGGLGFDFVFCFGFGVFFFLFMLYCCGGLSISYAYHYFVGGVFSCILVVNMVVFLFSMFGLVMSGNGLSSFIFWELLGVVSFFLILFYGNSVSLKAGWVTLVTSRFGDLGFFLFVGYFLSCFDDWWVLIFAFLLIIGSKSAVYPLISWLLEAMRAPTPVSSLVHSSTLVAAGFWFLYQYWHLIINFWFVVWFGWLCVLTIFLTSLVMLLVDDVKKIVALSTSNNLSWCFLFFLWGDMLLGLLQLVVHGLGKCVLFTVMGELMSCNGSGQDYKGFYFGSNWLLCNVFFCAFSLCGFPFLGVYFSKHYFFSLIFMGGYSLFVGFVLLLGVLFSFCYSFRFVFICFGSFYGGCYNFQLSSFFGGLFIPFFCFLCYFYLESFGVLFEHSSWIVVLVSFICFLGVCLGGFMVFYTNCFGLYCWGVSLCNLDFICYGFSYIFSLIQYLSFVFLFRLDSFVVSSLFYFICCSSGLFFSFSFFLFLV
uniref:NADH:ubiquinone reductase (H(+)-translocating) n=1 Tax=Sindiplozoon sp. DZ-2018 TaxID=2340795 RepID=A0A386PW45_9PLAT|nr:NADH dehydrogenase subunit 5 [Sindiplozoon sp. DZ-2018]